VLGATASQRHLNKRHGADADTGPETSALSVFLYFCLYPHDLGVNNADE